MGLGHGVTAEKDANERVKQQLGLPMWGDKDKDGVPNILDCWPMDRKRQGPENDMDDEGATVDEEGRPSGTFRRGRTDSEGEDLFREARKKTGRAETSEEIPSEWYTLPYPVEPEASVSYGNEPEVTVTFPEEREPSTTTQLTSYAKRLIKEKFRTPEEKEIARLEKIKEGGQGYVTLKRAQILAEEATKRERIRQARGKPQFMIGTGQAALSGLPPPTGIGAMQTAQIAGTGAGIGQFAMIPGASTGGAGFAQMTPQQAAGGMGFAQMTGGGWPQLPTGGGLDTSVPTGQAIDVPAAQEIAPPTASLVPSAPKRQVIARSTNVCPEGMVYSQRSRRCVRFERGPYRKTQQ